VDLTVNISTSPSPVGLLTHYFPEISVSTNKDGLCLSESGCHLEALPANNTEDESKPQNANMLEAQACPEGVNLKKSRCFHHPKNR
jgi:hypothetical protein